VEAKEETVIQVHGGLRSPWMSWRNLTRDGNVGVGVVLSPIITNQEIRPCHV
jgi:hypothetical protein